MRSWKRRIQRRKDTGMYRAAKDTLQEREKKKLLEKETWFLPKPDELIEINVERQTLKGRRL